MAILIGFLTLLMVLDCLIVILLVLIQLPKKDAGAGLAFGSGATDALFGAGSGTVLTKITKYAAGTFFAMALILSILQSNYHRRAGAAFEKQVSGGGPTIPFTAPAAPPASTNPAGQAINTNALKVPAAEATNTPQPVAAPLASTNPPAPPK